MSENHRRNYAFMLFITSVLKRSEVFYVSVSDEIQFRKRKNQTTCDNRSTFSLLFPLQSLLQSMMASAMVCGVLCAQLLSACCFLSFPLNKSFTVMRGFYSQFRCLNALRKS